MPHLPEMNADQRREKINADQRFEAWRDARRQARACRGSLIWREMKGEAYLARSYYDASGLRRQTVEGRRSPDTEAMKADWDRGRARAKDRETSLRDGLDRQCAINKALRLGRMPLIGARIVRGLDDAGLLGKGVRVVGTNALYAYEAAAGVFVDAGVTATQDIDLLLDARRALRIVADAAVPDGALMSVLRKIDPSFDRARETFRAIYDEGYLVDLVRPLRMPPWQPERESIGGDGDLVAAPIDGLVWRENAPSFEAIVIDEKGVPLRMIVPDPRVFAIHKWWLSQQPDRDPVKRPRDRAQAEVVAQLVARYLTHLPVDGDALRMLPLPVFRSAAFLFRAEETGGATP